MNNVPFEFVDGPIRIVKKGEMVQPQGTNIHKGFFVKSGLLKSYSIDEQGKMSVFMFAPEGWLISDIQSHTFNEPTELFIDAVEDSEIIELDTSTFDFNNITKEQQQEMVMKLLRRVGVLQKRVIMLMSASARQRYEHFLETYPQLVNRVSLKLIASYLGITPEALSTIRAQYKKEKV